MNGFYIKITHTVNKDMIEALKSRRGLCVTTVTVMYARVKHHCNIYWPRALMTFLNRLERGQSSWTSRHRKGKNPCRPVNVTQNFKFNPYLGLNQVSSLGPKNEMLDHTVYDMLTVCSLPSSTVKASHSPVVSKIDNRLEQYTSAAQVGMSSTLVTHEVDSYISGFCFFYFIFISVLSKSFCLCHLGLQDTVIYNT